MRDDIMAVQKQIEELKEKSLAWEMVEDHKKTNKRMFILLIIILCMWFATIGYLVYILNDIGTETNSIDIQDVEKIDNSHIRIGDTIYEFGEDEWEE